MAMKAFCDNPVCNKEFSKDELFGKFTYLTAGYTKQMQKEIFSHELMFCENCTKDLLEKINEAVDRQKKK
jgi:hypothetical protein